MGHKEATLGGTSPLFDTFGLGNHAGGGVAQDQRGRVQVVGTTLSLNFPLAGSGRPRSTALSPAGQPNLEDGVRAVLDLLPAGVGRTDGTGATPSGGGLTFPLPLTDGGTTPPCDIAPFGLQLGVAPSPQRRLLIDFEGPPPAAGTSAGIVVMRAPPTSSWTIAALQIGFPGGLSNYPLLLNGMELWTPSAVTVLYYFPKPNATFHDVISGLPPSPAQFTVQVAFLLTAPVTAGHPPSGVSCAGTEFFAASPALFLDY